MGTHLHMFAQYTGYFDLTDGIMAKTPHYRPLFHRAIVYKKDIYLMKGTVTYFTWGVPKGSDVGSCLVFWVNTHKDAFLASPLVKEKSPH